ncbi:MAG: hypothetical protein WCJ39_00220 [bacterium]
MLPSLPVSKLLSVAGIVQLFVALPVTPQEADWFALTKTLIYQVV